VELQERAVRLSRSEQPRRPIAHLAGELGVHPEGLRNWIRQDETNRGERDDRLTTEQLEELRRANEILKAASRFSPPSSTVPGRGDPHERPASGSFRVRADLPGSCRRRPAPTHPQAPPASARDQRDDRLQAEIRRVWKENSRCTAPTRSGGSSESHRLFGTTVKSGEASLAWILLTGAIASEVIATTALKLSNGFTRPAPSIVVAVGYLLSFALLAQALKLRLQVSVAYAVWSGVGTAAITVIGMLLLNEPLTAAKGVGIALVIGGVVALNLSGAH
jgi:small multidrug resistance pump